MSGNNLGRLEKVDLRTAWASEAAHFTPWLAESENLKLLGEVIGIELELEAQEKDVGPFRADILCKDTGTGNWVLIENQLEKTDHVHLGQLLAYAAGLKAVTIVWVAAHFTEEHRATLDWLNEITDDSFTFFGLEVELWRIAESRPAPKFNIVSKPNNWTREVAVGASRVQQRKLTEAQLLQLSFWTAFRGFVLERETSIKPTKPFPQHWMSIGMGRAGFNLSAIASFFDSESGSYGNQEIRAELVLDGSESKQRFGQLEAGKNQIEAEFGQPLVWHNPEGARMCRIYIRKGVNLHDRQNWPEYHTWILEELERLKTVFGPRIKGL